MEYVLWALVAVVAYGLVPPLTSIVTKDVSAAIVLFFSTVVFLGFTVVVMLLTGTARVEYALIPAAALIYIAGVFLAIGILAYYTALETGPVSLVVPIYGLFIVGSSVIGILFFNEAVTLTRAAGIGCAVLAIVCSGGVRA